MNTYTQSNREVMESVLSKEYIDLMLFFDAIIGNKDRHYRNVHLYRDNYGNIREAPLLDNGDSLMATDVLRSTSTLGSYMANKFNKSATIARTHDKQLEYITTIRTNGINIDSLARECILAIKPVLKYMDAGRTSAISKYLIYRVRKYYGLLK